MCVCMCLCASVSLCVLCVCVSARAQGVPSPSSAAISRLLLPHPALPSEFFSLKPKPEHISLFHGKNFHGLWKGTPIPRRG